MSGRLQRLAAALHRLCAAVCAALVALLLGAELAIVLLRYCLGTGFLELQDFAAYLFACLVSLGLPVALVADRHVRVDVLRERQGAATRSGASGMPPGVAAAARCPRSR